MYFLPISSLQFIICSLHDAVQLALRGTYQKTKKWEHLPPWYIMVNKDFHMVAVVVELAICLHRSVSLAVSFLTVNSW